MIATLCLFHSPTITFNPCHPERCARERARESKDPEGASCNHAASGSSTETFRGERLDAAMQRTLHRGPSTLPRSSRREVPLRMTEVNSIVEHWRHSHTYKKSHHARNPPQMNADKRRFKILYCFIHSQYFLTLSS